MYDIITLGSATMDIVVKPKNLSVLKYKKDSFEGEGISLPIGSKIEVDDMKFFSGGGGTNTAATFALQGLKTAYLGSIGTDVAGREIMQELRNFKINTSLMSFTDKKPTNHSIVILTEERDRTILSYRGASDLMNRNNIPWRKIKSKWLYLAPLHGPLCDISEEIVDFAKQNKMKVALNPNVSQLCLKNFLGILNKIDVLLLNQEEASFLTKIPFSQEKEIFKKIDEMCPGIAIMTKGREGVVVSDGKYIYSAKAPFETKIVDTTGAGDSFGSGFITELMRTNDVEKAIQLGMANSQGCLSEMGAKNGLLKKGQDYKKVEVLKESI